MLAAVIHETVQPLSAVILNTQAIIRYLSQTPPNVEAARTSLRAVLRDSFDVSQTIRHGRGLFQGTDIPKAPVDL